MGQRQSPDAMELPSQKILPDQALGNAGGVVFVQSDAPAHRLKGRQLRPRPFPVQRMVLVGEVEAQHHHAEQQRDDTQRQVAAANPKPQPRSNTDLPFTGASLLWMYRSSGLVGASLYDTGSGNGLSRSAQRSWKSRSRRNRSVTRPRSFDARPDAPSRSARPPRSASRPAKPSRAPRGGGFMGVRSPPSRLRPRRRSTGRCGCGGFHGRGG